jgi:hypothetical protein
MGFLEFSFLYFFNSNFSRKGPSVRVICLGSLMNLKGTHPEYSFWITSYCAKLLPKQCETAAMKLDVVICDGRFHPSCGWAT